MREIIQFLPQWSEVRRSIDANRSCLLLGPRYYGKRLLLDQLADEYRRARGDDCITLAPSAMISGGKLHYQQLWESSHKQLGIRTRYQVTDASSFQIAFSESIRRKRKRTLIFINGPGRNREQPYYELLNSINHLLEWLRNSSSPVIVVATDDYSTYLYQESPGELDSPFTYLDTIHCAPLERSKVKSCVNGYLRKKKETSLNPAQVDKLVEKLHKLCGGHPGLLLEAIRDVESANWDASLFDAHLEDSNFLTTSHILQGLERALGEDPLGLTKAALMFSEARVSPQNDPKVHLLRELGILQRISGLSVKLCGGLVTQLIEVVHLNARAQQPRTSATDSDGNFAAPISLDCSPDDFVVIHLSDIHVGEGSYRFRMEIPSAGSARGRVVNESKPALEDLIAEDIASLDLTRRIDVLILSGDFVWNGQEMSEFRQARRIVESLLKNLNLSKTQMLLIPGNHDVGWNPHSLESTGASTQISYDNYSTFLELLGCGSHESPVVKEFVSQSGKARLQIVGFDSNRVEGPNNPGIGYVPREQLAAARAAFLKSKEEKEEHGEEIPPYRWFVVHHHVFPSTWLSIEEAQIGKHSLLANASEVLSAAADFGVEMILHGHEHQPCLTEARRWPRDNGMGRPRVISLGAGSCSAADHLGPFSRNHYYVIRRRVNDMVIQSRCLGDSGVSFVEHDNIIIPTETRLAQFGAAALTNVVSASRSST